MSWRHYVGIFLLSLTRVLSVALWYHFGFLVISTALLGFGASGGALALWQGLRERAALDRTLTLLALLFGVLAGLLVCTGMGASLAGHLHSQPQQHLRWIIPLLLVTLVVTASLTPWLFAAALALSLVWRILLALLLLAPLGVLLGLPFPTGLRVVANEAAALVPWAWGVNGFFTVIGTAVALMLGGIRLRRDSWVSVRYAEGLHSSQSSATHQRTDRQEIVDQKPADFQRSL